MDLVLTLSIIILHHVTHYTCKPVTEKLNGTKREENENYAAITELFKDLQKENVQDLQSIAEINRLGDESNVLHMIQVIQEDGIKAPVAILLSSADLTTDLHEYDKKDVPTTKSRNDIDLSSNTLHPLNQKELYALKEGLKNHFRKMNVPIEITSQENIGKQANTDNIKPYTKSDEITKSEFINAESLNSDESKIPVLIKTSSQENIFDLINSKYDKGRVIEDLMYENEKQDLWDINDYGENHDLDLKYNYIKDLNLYDDEELNSNSKLIFQSEEWGEDTNKYNVGRSHKYKLPSNKRINPQRTEIKEATKQDSHEELSNEDVTLIKTSNVGQLNDNISDSLSKTNYFEVTNEAQSPESIVYDINNICKSQDKINRKLKNKQLGLIRTYNFVFNR